VGCHASCAGCAEKIGDDMGETAKVCADPRQAWRYGQIMTTAFAVLAPIVSLCGLAAGAIVGAPECATVAALVFAGGSGFGFGMGLLWRRRAGRVSYRVDDRGLSAYRGERLVWHVDRRQIAGFRIDGVMNVRAALFGAAPPPGWPQGVVELVRVDGQHSPTRKLLPEIMIWGASEVRAAEARLQAALRSTGPLGR